MVWLILASLSWTSGDPEHWTLLRVEGEAVIFGWNEARPRSGFARLAFDADRLAFGLQDEEARRQLPSVLGLGLVTLPVPLHRSQRRGKTSSHLRSSSASVRSRMPLPAQSGHSVASACMTHLQFVRDRHNFAPGLVGLAERHRRQCGRHIGVAKVDRRRPHEGPLAASEVDEEGQHIRSPKVERLNCAVHK